MPNTSSCPSLSSLRANAEDVLIYTILLLHLTHMRAKQMELEGEPFPDPLPFANPDGDAGKLAIGNPKSNLNSKVSIDDGDGDGDDAEPIAVKDLLFEFIVAIDQAGRLAAAEAHKISDNPEIPTLDLMDVFTGKAPYQFKVYRVQGEAENWPKFGDRVQLMLSCTGLGD